MATAESIAIRQAVAAEKQAVAWESIDIRLARIEKAFEIKAEADEKQPVAWESIDIRLARIEKAFEIKAEADEKQPVTETAEVSDATDPSPETPVETVPGPALITPIPK